MQIKLLKNQSRSRRLQYEWLSKIAGKLTHSEKVVDLGGVRGAEYQGLLGLKPQNIEVWNFDPSSQPNQLVDLDQVEKLPPLPRETKLVLAMNLLEHLYRPFELLEWVTENLAKGGQLVVVVPFVYRVHPSPQDFWRMTPQAFERFFKEQAERKGIYGELEVVPLADGVRDVTSIFTADLFKGGKTGRLLGTLIEGAGAATDVLAGAFLGKKKLADWAAKNPPAIGLIWKKSPSSKKG